MKSFLTKSFAVLCACALVLTLSACKNSSDNESLSTASGTSVTSSDSSKSSNTSSKKSSKKSSEKSSKKVIKKYAKNSSKNSSGDSSKTTSSKASTTYVKGPKVQKFLGNWKMSELTITWSDTATQKQKETLRKQFAETYGEGLSDKEYLKKYAGEFDDRIDTSPVYIFIEGGTGEMRFGTDGNATSAQISWSVRNDKLTANGETPFVRKGKNLVSEVDSDGLKMTAVFYPTDKVPAMAENTSSEN